MIAKARDYAIAAHGGQKYGEKPYVHHLDAVAKILEPYGDEARIVGYLHDVVEDTHITILEIEEEFGQLVSACVAILTDEPGSNRKERKTRTYAKMSKVSGSEELALVVKAADRLANIEACIFDDNRSLLSKYQNEHEAFCKAVYRKGLCDDIWLRINNSIETHHADPGGSE